MQQDGQSFRAIEKGPVIGRYYGRDIPQFIINGLGERSDFVRVEPSPVDITKLGDDECIIAPGLVYKRQRQRA